MWRIDLPQLRGHRVKDKDIEDDMSEIVGHARFRGPAKLVVAPNKAGHAERGRAVRSPWPDAWIPLNVYKTLAFLDKCRRCV
jgi:hypothetical protein